jgi:hypothetical protein
VIVEGVERLPDLDGLGRLAYVGGSLMIRAGFGENAPEHVNAELASIEGLGNLESVAGDVQIENNPKLPTCAAEALVDRLVYFYGSVSIAGNDDTATCD